MDKDLYIEFLESEIRRIRAGGNQLYGMLSACPCPDQDKCDSCGRTQEVQDLKLENDRLKQRANLMVDFICSISCSLKVCHECKLNRPDEFDELGAKCAYLQGSAGLEYIRSEAYNLIKQLEDL